ncbi:MAG: hypothetical protein ACXVQX_11240 [Actinomycetota bacterium]
MTESPASFALSFTPTLPNFSGQLKSVWVSNPQFASAIERSVAFVFTFTADQGFTSDGRLDVVEGPARGTESDLEQMLNNNGTFPGADFSLHQVGPTHILLMNYQGVGRAEFLKAGVWFDITGPAAPTQQVLDLASRLSQQ